MKIRTPNTTINTVNRGFESYQYFFLLDDGKIFSQGCSYKIALDLIYNKLEL